jgi:hypothetical protein
MIERANEGGFRTKNFQKILSESSGDESNEEYDDEDLLSKDETIMTEGNSPRIPSGAVRDFNDEINDGVEKFFP